MEVGKLKIGKLKSANVKAWHTTNKRKPDNLLAEENGYYFYDAAPNEAGDVVKIVEHQVAINSYLVQHGSELIVVPCDYVEVLKDTKIVLTQNLTSKRVKQNTKTAKSRTKRETKTFSGSRKQQIAACEKCGGDPSLTTFELSDFIGTRCTECWLINEYQSKN